MTKRSNDLALEVMKQGFVVKRTKSGWMAYSKDGRSTTTWHISPSDHRAMKNILARLRRIGVDTAIL